MPGLRTRCWIATLALGLALALGPGAARAAGGVRRFPLAGKPHDFVVPEGWEATADGGEIKFRPAGAPVGASLQCSVTAGVDDTGGKAPAVIAREVAQAIVSQQSQLRFQVGQPEAATFLGAPGAMITLTFPVDGKDAGLLLVVARANGLLYSFWAGGAIDDLKQKRAQDDLEAILDGVKLAPGGGAGPAGPVGGGGAGPRPGSGTGAGAGAGAGFVEREEGPRRAIDDPAWGLQVQGLPPNWRLTLEDDGYVLSSNAPQATVLLQFRRAPDARRYARTIGRHAPGKLGVYDALVVDGLSVEGARERAFHVVRDGRAIVVRFSSVAFGEAQGLLAQLGGALVLAPPRTQERKGVGLETILPNGIALALPATWRFDDGEAKAIGAGSVRLRGPGDVVAKVRVYRLEEHEADPFVSERDLQQRRCQFHGRTFAERPETVKGARKAVRLTCQGKDSGAILVLAEGRANGRPVYLSVIAFHARKTATLPEAQVGELLGRLQMPGE